MGERTVVRNRSINILLTAISGTAGIAALILPFAEDMSPLRAVIELFPIYGFNWFWEFSLIAIPFFLSVLISAAYARWLITGALIKLERAFAYTASSITLLSLFYFEFFLITLYDTEILVEPWWWLSVPIGVLMLFACVYNVIKNLKDKESNVVVAMQYAYLINFYLCFVLFFSELQIGAYCAVVTSCVYLIQITQPVLRLSIVQVEDMDG